MAGVGGRTIEQARERMPVEEVGVWQAYMQKHGPIALQRISRYAAAQTTQMLHNIHAKNKARNIEEFLLWGSSESDDDDDDGDGLDRVFRELNKYAAPGEVKRKLWKRKE